MSKPAFPGIEPIRYQPDAPANALAFRYYDKDKTVRGKRMEDHLRMAVCYWHTFVWNGFDVFGAGTFNRPWHREGADPVELAQEKAAVAFELFSKLGVPFFCFRDRDGFCFRVHDSFRSRARARTSAREYRACRGGRAGFVSRDAPANDRAARGFGEERQACRAGRGARSGDQRGRVAGH